MNHDHHLVCAGWRDYELLDSGENMKLERFGEVIVARPETQALWAKARPELWKDAHAAFAFRDKRGSWDIRKKMPEEWELGWGGARFSAKLTGFKHVGAFPEQAPNWEWTAKQITKLKEPKVLNLFGYTGIATTVAALAGAKVTHVDASKQSIDWARANARRSRVPDNQVRWLTDDALAFVKREARRGAIYDGIILDPPAFGRGAKGEVWRIEEDLPTLLATLDKIFSKEPGSFFLLNGYAAGYASRSLAQAVESAFGSALVKDGEAGELHLKESSTPRVLPAGIYTRFVR